ncbi:MAG: clostripain-related cysteine peptidase [Candidatus Kariarchaeaceae archaeon]
MTSLEKKEVILKAEPSLPSAQVADSWTVMVWLDGDNNLHEAALEDINEMERVGSTAEVNIIVFADLYGTCDHDANADGYADHPDDPWSGGKLLHIEQDTDMTTITSTEITGWSHPEEPNMGSYTLLDSFITWTQSNYPADNYALILWDHGGGWFDGGGDQDVTPLSLKIDRLGMKGVCWDDTNNHDALTQNELQIALTGKGIDLLGFDACLMGQVEIAYDFKDLVSTIVFSEEYEAGDGWPYDDIFGPFGGETDGLTVNPEWDASRFGQEITEDFINSYNSGTQGYDTWQTMSVIDTSYLDTVADNLDILATVLIENITSENTLNGIMASVATTEAFYYPQMLDLYDLCSNFEATIANTTITDAASAVKTAINLAVTSSGQLSAHPDANGLSIYFPISEEDYSVDYNGAYGILDMSEDHLWDEFLNAWYGNSGSVSGEGASPGTAIPITQGTHTGSTPLPGEAWSGWDETIYYKFYVGEGNTAEITFTDDAGTEVDFDIFLINSSLYIVNNSMTENDLEVISATANITGYFYLMVAHYSGSGSYSFDLYISNSEFGGDSPNNPITIPSIPAVVTNVLPGPGNELYAGEWWYEIYLEDGQTIEMILNGPRDGEDFDAYLYAPAVDLTYYLATGCYSADYPDEAMYTTNTSGWFLILILAYPYGDLTQTGVFTLELSIVDGSSIENAIPIIEDGSYIGTAPLPGPQYIDWNSTIYYQIDLSEGDYVELTLTGDTGTDFDLFVLNSSLEFVVYSATGSYPEEVSFEVNVTGIFYIMIVEYYLSGPGSYLLTVEVTNQGDTFENAIPIIEGSYSSASPLPGPSQSEGTWISSIFYVFWIELGEEYQISLTGDVDTDFDIFLYDGMTFFDEVSNSMSESYPEYIEGISPSSQYMYIMVVQYYDSEDGGYELVLNIDIPVVSEYQLFNWFIVVFSSLAIATLIQRKKH